MLDYNAEGWGINSRWTRLQNMALESHDAKNAFFFSKILILELGFGQ